MQLNLDTIIIFCRDTDRLKSFYAGAFELPVLEEQPAEWVLLQAGLGKIGLHKIGQDHPESHTNTATNIKIVFETKQDIRAVRQGLIENHIPMHEIKSFQGYDYFTCDGEDPEGNVFQIKQKKQNGSQA